MPKLLKKKKKKSNRPEESGLNKFSNTVLPILSAGAAVIAFFVGQNNANRQLELDLLAAQQEKSQFEIENARLKDEHSTEVQFNYISLITTKLSDNNYPEASILVQLVENEQVRDQLLEIYQKKIESNRTLSVEEKFDESVNLANVKNNIKENQEEQATAVIKQIQDHSTGGVSTADSTMLEELDRQEIELQTDRLSDYKEMIALLDAFNGGSPNRITAEQQQDFLRLQSTILEKYADKDIRDKLNELSGMLRDRRIGPASRAVISEVKSKLNENLELVLWCKERYYVNWNNIKCAVKDLRASRDYVDIDLSYRDSDSTFVRNKRLSVGESFIYSLGGDTNDRFEIKLLKIDHAGKNFLKKAGYFEYKVLPAG